MSTHVRSSIYFHKLFFVYLTRTANSPGATGRSPQYNYSEIVACHSSIYEGQFFVVELGCVSTYIEFMVPLVYIFCKV